VEEIFGWIKTVGGMRKLWHRGLQSVGWMFTLAAAAYNMVRMRNLATAIAVAKAWGVVCRNGQMGPREALIPVKTFIKSHPHSTVGRFLAVS
jgi:hypothetical protein